MIQAPPLPTCARFALIALALLLPPASAVAQIIDMEVTPSRGTIDDVFEVTVRIVAPNQQALERYDSPTLDEFRVIDRNSDMTLATTRDQGAVQHVALFTYRYVIAATRTGLSRIGRASVRVHGRDYRTKDRMVEITGALPEASAQRQADDIRPGIPAGPAPAPLAQKRPLPGQGFSPPPLPPSASRPNVFVHASVDQDKVYVGQQITVTWTLYTRHELIAFDPNVPRTDDFWTEILYEPDKFVRQGDAFVNGIRYQVATVSKRALFPLRSGNLIIAPYTARASALDTPLGTRLDVSSEALAVKANPLPAGAPPDFDSSYTGLFKVYASVDRDRVPLGEPLVLSVAVRGHGAIRRTTRLDLRMPGFDIEPVSDFQENVQSTDKTALGERIYTYWLTPTRAGPHTIPAIRVPYFDPHTGAYETASSRAIPIVVVNRSAFQSANSVATPPKPAGARATANRWWLPGVLFAFAAVFTIIGWRMRARFAHQDSALGAGERANLAARRFRHAERHLAHSRWPEFFRELADILERSLEVRLRVPVRAVPRARLLALLAEHGVSADTIERVREQLEQCDLARFASQRGELAEMRDALKRTRELTRRL